MSSIRYVQTLDNLPEVLSVKDIGKLLGVGYSKAMHTVKYSDMGYIKLGNSYKVYSGHFLAWLTREGKRIYSLNE